MDNIVIIFGISAILAAVFKKLKMPLIVGFLVAGLLLGTSRLTEYDSHVIEHFAEYGASFLMMIIGLELNFKHFKTIGTTVIWMGLLQIVLFFLVVFGLSTLLNYSIFSSVVFSAVLTFSSTLLVASVLRDKRELNSMHGRVLLGILLLQDLLVVILLFVMPFFVADTNTTMTEMVSKILFVILSIILLVFVGRFVFKYIRDLYKKDHSIVFLLTIAWLFLWIDVFHWEIFEVPPEIVGLAVGLSLSGVYEADRVANWFDPVKDYFVVFLFFYVGMKVDMQWLIKDWFLLLELFLLVMVVKAFIGWVVAAIARMPRKVIMVIGFGLANVSELGFVILPLAFRLGIMGERELSLLSGLILITLVTSSIILYNTNEFCFGFCSFFKLLERRKLIAKQVESDKLTGRKVLIGCHRSGWAMLKSLDNIPEDLVILDYDINVVENLKKSGYQAMLADISDQRFLYEVGLCKAKMIISTIPNFSDSIGLLNFLNNNCSNKRPYFAVVSSNKMETAALYEVGADLAIDKYISTANALQEIFCTSKRKTYEKKVKKNQASIYDMNLIV